MMPTSAAVSTAGAVRQLSDRFADLCVLTSVKEEDLSALRAEMRGAEQTHAVRSAQNDALVKEIRKLQQLKDGVTAESGGGEGPKQQRKREPTLTADQTQEMEDLRASIGRKNAEIIDLKVKVYAMEDEYTYDLLGHRATLEKRNKMAKIIVNQLNIHLVCIRRTPSFFLPMSSPQVLEQVRRAGAAG